MNIVGTYGYQRGSIKVITIGVITVLLLGAIGYMVWQTMAPTDQVDQSIGAEVDSSKGISPEEERDNIRREHAKDMFATLFYRHVVGKAIIEESQRGLDTLLTTPDGNPIVDPLTNQPYQYNADQSAQKPGEVTFRVGGSCDNKVEGAGGIGLIKDGIGNSGAIAIKLEASGYACVSNI